MIAHERGYGGRLGAILALALFCSSIGSAQDSKTTTAKKPIEPSCAAGAVCFSGEVLRGLEFRRALNSDLEFVLEPGWTTTIVPKRQEGECGEFAYAVNAPYHQHRDLDINVTYGWTAEDEVSVSPRTFRFVTNCADQRTEAARLGIVLWGGPVTRQKYDEALSKLGSSALGQGRLWITGAKISHSGDTAEEKWGEIEWMRFNVEIRLPR